MTSSYTMRMPLRGFGLIIMLLASAVALAVVMPAGASSLPLPSDGYPLTLSKPGLCCF
jgi:hypothetical protein